MYICSSGRVPYNVYLVGWKGILQCIWLGAKRWKGTLNIRFEKVVYHVSGRVKCTLNIYCQLELYFTIYIYICSDERVQ